VSRLPGVAVLAGYRHEWLRGDVLAGVAVVAYLVPQVMAYSGIAGLPPQAGLWACLPTVALALPLLVGMIVGSRLRPGWPSAPRTWPPVCCAGSR